MENKNQMKKNEITNSENYKYDDRTKQLMDLRAEAERQFDKQIVYLSGGALVFSIGYVKDIIGKNAVPQCKYLLIISWVCFAFALIINLLSYLSTRKAIDKELLEIVKHSLIYNKITIYLNWTSIIGLLIGLVFLITYAIINLK